MQENDRYKNLRTAIEKSSDSLKNKRKSEKIIEKKDLSFWLNAIEGKSPIEIAELLKSLHDKISIDQEYMMSIEDMAVKFADLLIPAHKIIDNHQNNEVLIKTLLPKN